MNDLELIKALHGLGIDEESHRVIALLPLVHVAWADGEVQSAERRLIERIARDHAMVPGDGPRILHQWLRTPPTAAYLQRGTRVLRHLARRERGLGADLKLETVSEVLQFCEDVANAAGGLFGLVWRVAQTERVALREIGEALDLDAHLTSDEVSYEADDGS